MYRMLIRLRLKHVVVPQSNNAIVWKLVNLALYVMKRTFGHRHLGFIFKPLLVLTENGFEYKDRLYTWDDVVSIKTIDSRNDLSMLFTKWPRALVNLRDGKFVLINGRALEEMGVKNKVGFWTRKSSSYEDLLSIFEANKPGQQTSRVREQ